MTTYSAEPSEASEAPQLAAYNQAAGLISSLAGAAHHTPALSPSLDLLSGLPLGTSPPHTQQQSAPGPNGNLAFGGLGAGLRAPGPFSGSVSPDAARKVETGEKQLCTFFLRTGTCAYGDRCKFKHPLDRPPPQLNSRGYPVRAEEPDCAHYLKKGWCAFGPTCKFNHPEIQPSILNTYSFNQPPTAYVSLPTTTFPSAAMYSVPSAVPTLYYLPPGVSPGQIPGSTVSLLPGAGVGAVAAAPASQLTFAQQSALAAAAPSQLYRQAGPVGPYGGVGVADAIGGGMGGGGGSSVSALQEAFQGLALGRTGGLMRGK